MRKALEEEGNEVDLYYICMGGHFTCCNRKSRSRSQNKRNARQSNLQLQVTNEVPMHLVASESYMYILLRRIQTTTSQEMP
jgi:hypothetical protein